ncbi:MAG: type II toxin-antitoxin system Phd/YefM family antitoxin [Nitrospirae bacterium]|nr:type II toxin-antitoxin system Phd/YefM family antitoxin [Nitrospirota bacterium]
MQTAYRRDEIVASSHASKHLGELLDRVKRKGRVVLSRKNRLEAVLVSVENYEEIIEDLEHLVTALEIGRRKTAGGKRISWDTLKSRHGL